jgi:large subunit ribosomal protein L25
MEIIALKAQPKDKSGKQAAKKVRHAGMAPAIMYKSGGGDSVQFSVDPAEFRHLVYTSELKVAEIELNGTIHKCILKDIQFHPVTEQVVHLDFLELTDGVKFNASVPLRFKGSAPGVKAGGKLLTTLRKIKIVTTPEKIVDKVHVDISKMELGDVIRVRDIELQEGVEIMNNSSVPIAAIEIPRALKAS